MLLAVGAALLQDSSLLVPIGSKYMITATALNVFTMTPFALAVHVLEKSGRKFFLLNVRVWS